MIHEIDARHRDVDDQDGIPVKLTDSSTLRSAWEVDIVTVYYRDCIGSITVSLLLDELLRLMGYDRAWWISWMISSQHSRYASLYLSSSIHFAPHLAIHPDKYHRYRSIARRWILEPP